MCKNTRSYGLLTVFNSVTAITIRQEGNHHEIHINAMQEITDYHLNNGKHQLCSFQITVGLIC